MATSTDQAYRDLAALLSNQASASNTTAYMNALLGAYNPTSTYQDQARVSVADPTLMNAQQYLNALGLTDYQYDADTIQQRLDNVTNAARAIEQAELQSAQNKYGRDMAAQQATAMDTLRQQYAQGIQNGINKGMQQANLLSSILGTSQAASEGAQELADQRVQAALGYYKDLQQNAVNAQNTATQNQQQLMTNIRQLYNDQIQNRTASLEYNASLQESLANYLASKYSADASVYGNAMNSAANIQSNAMNSQANAGVAYQNAIAQNNYSDAYYAAAKAAAAAQEYAADKSANATKYAADQQAYTNRLSADASAYAAALAAGADMTKVSDWYNQARVYTPSYFA